MNKSTEGKKLNKQQIEAVQHGEGPLLIIAGAGTGKTTVITERIKWLISKNFAKPSEILALTFTQKAAQEMEERVDLLMPYGYTQMWISTFHAFCDRVLRLEAIQIGLNPAYTLISDTDITLLLRKNIFHFGLDYFRPLGNPTKFISGMINHFSRLKDEDISPNEYLHWAQSQESKVKSLPAGEAGQNEEEKLEIKKIQELASAYKKYEELKIKENVMDYGDLISSTLRLFRTRKNILTNYQNQFKFVLVDEFQDTNIAQNELLLLLSAGSKNITAVADDDQSIYKFRGAAVSNVIAFRKRFPKSKLIVLTQNYRSTQEILDKSYRLIQHNNPDRLEAKEGIDKKLLSVRKEMGESIELIYTDRVEYEADEVVKKIKALAGSKTGSDPQPYSWKDFAILVRANNHTEPFVRSFLRYGIPFQFLGPGQLFRQPEIKDLISYLQVISNFEDNVSLYRVLAMPYFDISPRDLVAISNLTRKYNLSLFESCEVVLGIRKIDNIRLPVISTGSQEKITKVIGMITRHLNLLPKETAGQILYYFLEDTGMIKNILDYKFPIDEKKANNISKLFSKLKTYESEHEDASVRTVLDWIMLSMELGESPLATDSDWMTNDAVNILTVHSAKGLEFKVVFLVNLVSQRFPTTEKKEQIPIPAELIKEELPEGDYHEQEERRLFYVGMTRARDRLYFSAANFYGEGKRAKRLSPFISEALGDESVGAQITKPTSQLSLLDWHKEELVEKKSLKKIPSINYISYSQIDSFRLCPLHYKLHYVLNIPPPVSAALSFGSSVHNALK
ncbi:ATP-dependent helicase, partial [Candidatus Gottesmanbacteria bacterium]|nr:ATP-dependent helicase [Candidatus Gottesmanbacteria bacterium]